MKEKSTLMLFFEKIGMDNIAWSLRRLHCPISKDALVLEVGSGGNPYPRANVLLDAYQETIERHWLPLKVDRPMVIGFVENLPFKDYSFDFVIASHVLEHSINPFKFLSELQRVARAGYIEVPDAFMERINPYKCHRLEIALRENKLIIRKKKSWIEDKDIVELYENKAKYYITKELIPKHPFAFHVRYFWRDKVDFTILNPEINIESKTSIEDKPYDLIKQNFKVRLKGLLMDLLRFILSQNKRNKRINLLELLRCPACCSKSLFIDSDRILCKDCASTYLIKNGIPIMY